MKNFYYKIIYFLEENGSARKEYRDVYLFALNTVVVYTINISSGIIIGTLMREMFCCLIFLFAFILLRQEAGGYHAPGWKSCYFLSCGILILTLLWIKENFIYQTYITLTVAMATGAGIILFAPLEDKNKPLEEFEKKTIRKRAQIIVVAELVIGLVLLEFEKKAAYTIFCAVIWCGISYFAWAVKKHMEKNEKNKKSAC